MPIETRCEDLWTFHVARRRRRKLFFMFIFTRKSMTVWSVKCHGCFVTDQRGVRETLACNADPECEVMECRMECRPADSKVTAWCWSEDKF